MNTSFTNNDAVENGDGGPSVDGVKHPKRIHNFWDVGSYRKTIKRIEDGAVLLDDLKSMMQERAKIEKQYAQSLQQWSKKWDGKIMRGQEVYSTSTRSAWRSLLTEADRSATEHLRVEGKISGELQNKHTLWKKDNYQKGTVTKGKHKVTRKAEDGFNKAQQPWSKLWGKVERGKAGWHAACKNEDTANKKVDKLQTSSKVTQDEIQKAKDKSSKASSESTAAKDKYETRLQNLSDDVPRYRGEMQATFEFCQDVEQKRIDFFKFLMADYLRVLKVDYSPIYDGLEDKIMAINADADLVRYSDQHGVGQPLMVPQLVEYGANDSHGMVENTDVAESTAGSTFGGSSTAASGTYAAGACLDAGDDSDEEWDTVCPQPPAPEGKTLVRAIYDYVAEDVEELSIAVGDMVTQIEPEDAQGWCKGVDKDGKIGFYPAYYVESVTDESLQ